MTGAGLAREGFSSPVFGSKEISCSRWQQRVGEATGARSRQLRHPTPGFQPGFGERNAPSMIRRPQQSVKPQLLPCPTEGSKFPVLGLGVGAAEQIFPQTLNFHSNDPRKSPCAPYRGQIPSCSGLELEHRQNVTTLSLFRRSGDSSGNLSQPVHNLCFLMNMFPPPFSDSFFSQLSEIKEGSDATGVSSPQDSCSIPCLDPPDHAWCKQGRVTGTRHVPKATHSNGRGASGPQKRQNEDFSLHEEVGMLVCCCRAFLGD